MGDITKVTINNFFEIIGRKWTLDIIKNIYSGYDRFNDILNQNKGLSNKVLAVKLKQMEEDGLVIREIISDSPLVTRYLLTKKSQDLNQILYHINEFSYKYFDMNCSESGCDKTDKILK